MSVNRTHRRNLLISAATMLVVLLAGYAHTVLAAPLISLPRTDLQQAPTVVFSPSSTTLLRGGSVQTVSLLVTNTGTTTDSFNISFTPITGVNVSPASTTLTNIAPNATGQVQVQISASTTATVGPATLGANVIRQSNPSDVGSAQLAVTITDATATPTTAPASLQISLREGERIRTATPGNTVTYRLRIVNNGGSATTFNLAFDSTIRCSNDFSGCLQSFSGNTQNITLNPNAGFDFDVDITLPTDSSIVGNTSNTRVIATVGGVESAGLTLQINVVEATATPSNTPTNTPTQTPSLTPSPTETLGPICVDDFENDDSIGSAKLILVNLPQPQDPIRQENNDRRAICPGGDEDWLFFGAVAGKVYTIDVRDVAAGLDLSLEITDEDGNRIAFNDDFFERDPAINPRIQSWRAPATAIYYIRVRDVTSNGGTDLTYRIEVQDESFGPTPQTVTEICQDQFEPDGLSEQANLITSNERQFDRRLCPTGDADWVTFFGKRDKRYFLYTDTRPYFNNNPVNPGINVQAGADTVISLVDRDGSTIIDVNDDIPGGQTLDSQLEFVPETDGFYFLQVKNVGDVGNQFIRYDLTVQLCIPGQEDCGRAFREDEPVVTATSEIPTATLTEEFDLDATPTETPVP